MLHAMALIVSAGHYLKWQPIMRKTNQARLMSVARSECAAEVLTQINDRHAVARSNVHPLRVIRSQLRI